MVDSSNPYLRLKALVTGSGPYAALSDEDAEGPLNAPAPSLAPVRYQDVTISDVEGYLRARLLVTRLRTWVKTADEGIAKDAALELLDIIASPRLTSFTTSTETGRTNVLGLFALLVAATGGIVTQQHLAELTAMTVVQVPDISPREQIAWPNSRIWAADVTAARLMEG